MLSNCADVAARFRRQSILWLPLVIVMGGSLSLASAQRSDFAAEVQLTRIDSNVTHYATFQSHNQKVVANQYGIFTTHIRDRDQPYLAQTWRLSRSIDGGQTFTTVYQHTDPTNPPVIETDSRGTIYLIRVDFESGDAFLYRFQPETEFREPLITSIPGAAAGKYSMALDEPHRRLYFFAHNNTFHRLGLDGSLQRKIDLLQAGEDAGLQYPHLAVDDSARVHAGWTTQKHGEYLYWDIHHLYSDDQGDSWRNLHGDRVATPVVADQRGPTERITAADEFRAHTWLSNMIATGGKIHFVYLAQMQPPRQHYARYNLATGQRDQHLFPEFQGQQISIRGLDGFFVADPESPGVLYFVGNDEGRIGCLRSGDHGTSWHDHARSEARFSPYAIGGFRKTVKGDIIGTFTDQRASGDVLDFRSDVYFFSISLH